MIIRGIDHNQNVIVCDGSEMLFNFHTLLFTYHGTTFKCQYVDDNETHIKWQITRRKYGFAEPVVYYVNLVTSKAIEMTVDDMYYYILADCCDDYGVIK